MASKSKKSKTKLFESEDEAVSVPEELDSEPSLVREKVEKQAEDDNQSSLATVSPNLRVKTVSEIPAKKVKGVDLVNNGPQPLRIKYYSAQGNKQVGKVHVIPAGGSSLAGSYSPDVLKSTHFKELKDKNILRVRNARK